MKKSEDVECECYAYVFVVNSWVRYDCMVQDVSGVRSTTNRIMKTNPLDTSFRKTSTSLWRKKNGLTRRTLNRWLNSTELWDKGISRATTSAWIIFVSTKYFILSICARMSRSHLQTVSTSITEQEKGQMETQKRREDGTYLLRDR